MPLQPISETIFMFDAHDGREEFHRQLMENPIRSRRFSPRATTCVPLFPEDTSWHATSDVQTGSAAISVDVESSNERHELDPNPKDDRWWPFRLFNSPQRAPAPVTKPTFQRQEQPAAMTRQDGPHIANASLPTSPSRTVYNVFMTPGMSTAPTTAPTTFSVNGRTFTIYPEPATTTSCSVSHETDDSNATPVLPTLQTPDVLPSQPRAAAQAPVDARPLPAVRPRQYVERATSPTYPSVPLQSAQDSPSERPPSNTSIESLRSAVPSEHVAPVIVTQGLVSTPASDAVLLALNPQRHHKLIPNLEGGITWFASHSDHSIPSPPAVEAQDDDIYIHTVGTERQIWIRLGSAWAPIHKGYKHTGLKRRLRVRLNGEPYWMLYGSYATYVCQEKRAGRMSRV